MGEDIIHENIDSDYKWGFTTDIEMETMTTGLSEDVVKFISGKKEEAEFMLNRRLKAYNHWLNMKEPAWANVKYPKINYQDIIYYAAPKQTKKMESLDELDPKIKEMYDKLGIPLIEQQFLAGVAVDAVIDSVSVVTTYKEKL
ncbi:MAG: Fe-S cluster assembly protein SufB, partial [Ignavibacteriae bacterium]|nr:Fe-S cluster assembly protein SufB [Ignavibacteriota bacterium]